MPEAIPALVYVIGLFFAIVGYVTARGLLATWTHSLGYMFEWLAKELRFHVTILFKTVVIDLGGPFRAVDGWVRTALQNWCTGAEIEMGYFLHGLEELARYMAEAIDILARETAQTFDGLVNVHLPKWARNAIAVAFPLGYLAKLIADQVRKAIPQVRREVHTITHTIDHTVTRVIVKTGAVALPGALGLPKIRRDIGSLWKWRTHAEARLRKVEGLFAAGVMAAVLANALGIATRCVRRGNVAKAARSICGLDSSLFESLLGDLIAITSVLSVVEFATELRAVEDEAIAIMGKLVREWPS